MTTASCDANARSSGARRRDHSTSAIIPSCLRVRAAARGMPGFALPSVARRSARAGERSQRLRPLSMKTTSSATSRAKAISCVTSSIVRALFVCQGTASPPAPRRPFRDRGRRSVRRTASPGDAWPTRARSRRAAADRRKGGSGIGVPLVGNADFFQKGHGFGDTLRLPGTTLNLDRRPSIRFSRMVSCGTRG